MKNLCLKKILISVGISILLSVIMLLIVTALVHFGDLDERTISALVLGVSVLCVVAGAFILARNIPGGGLINGLALGVIYFAGLLVLSIAVNGSVALDMENITRALLIIVAGMLGGVLGINTAK